MNRSLTKPGFRVWWLVGERDSDGLRWIKYSLLFRVFRVKGRLAGGYCCCATWRLAILRRRAWLVHMLSAYQIGNGHIPARQKSTSQFRRSDVKFDRWTCRNCMGGSYTIIGVPPVIIHFHGIFYSIPTILGTIYFFKGNLCICLLMCINY